MSSQDAHILDSREVTSYLSQVKRSYPAIHAILLLDKVGKVCASSDDAESNLTVATLASAIWKGNLTQVMLEFPQEEVQAQFAYLSDKTLLTYKIGTCLLCVEFGPDAEVGMMNLIATKIAGNLVWTST